MATSSLITQDTCGPMESVYVYLGITFGYNNCHDFYVLYSNSQLYIGRKLEALRKPSISFKKESTEIQTKEPQKCLKVGQTKKTNFDEMKDQM